MVFPVRVLTRKGYSKRIKMKRGDKESSKGKKENVGLKLHLESK